MLKILTADADCTSELALKIGGYLMHL